MGIHRFYVKRIFTGILMLLTMGGFGIWWIIDIILIIAGIFKDKDGNVIRRS
jgi:TM2 domain-containing membrane protein YozV